MDKASHGLLVDGLINVALTAIPLLPFGGPGMVVARAALDAIKMTKETMGLTREQMDAIEESRTALELAVNEHAKRVADRLAG